MGTTFSKTCAAFLLLLTAAFAVPPVPAQTATDISSDVPLRQADETADSSPTGTLAQPKVKPGKGSATVSVDFLRHPVSAKVRQRLLKALDKMASGEHDAAIGQLLETLKKYPDSAAYVYSLLGVEYARTNRFDAAVHALEQGALLLPHEAMAHYNFGLALICAGDYDRAAQEVQRALELDPKNTTFQARLNALQGHVRSGN